MAKILSMKSVVCTASRSELVKPREMWSFECMNIDLGINICGQFIFDLVHGDQEVHWVNVDEVEILDQATPEQAMEFLEALYCPSNLTELYMY